MTNMLEQAATLRFDTINATSTERRNALAQHLTPIQTARLAARLFSKASDSEIKLRVLDLGAGTGILSLAVFEKYGIRVNQFDAVEADPLLAQICENEIRKTGVPYSIICGDALLNTPCELYDRVILNPPYKKMASSDKRQELLPCHAANLYSAFISIGLERLSVNGELVAIVPRSWMNGDYFLPFRKYVLNNYSLDCMHIYGSRSEVFSDTNVLQETMIVRFSKKKQISEIRVSESVDKSSEPVVNDYKACDLIDAHSLVVRVAPANNRALAGTIASEGLCPSTGKVVDFRSRERVYEDKPDVNGVVPLIYAGNFAKGELIHPLSFGKPQWFRADDVASLNQVTLPGYYVVVKRFSSKEERRRVVAYPFDVREPLGIENHLNFIHEGKPRKVVPLRSWNLACGVALWLNSTFIDNWFRDVSGSTQVNAGDIKAMPSPTLEQLEGIGAKWTPNLTQKQIDEICEVL